MTQPKALKIQSLVGLPSAVVRTFIPSDEKVASFDFSLPKVREEAFQNQLTLKQEKGRILFRYRNKPQYCWNNKSFQAAAFAFLSSAPG